MSHLHERSEKVCLNCGTQLQDRYCHKCGQENVEPKESFGHLLGHFISDLLHFDGKFFTTLKYLFFKPGFLTEEYIKGRRASHINPIRMYLFISAMFFLLYMSFFINRSNSIHDTSHENDSTVAVVNKTDSGLTKITEGLNTAGEAFKEDDKPAIDTIANDSNTTITRSGRSLEIRSKNPSNGWAPQSSVAEYDSMQKLLPKRKRDNFILQHYKRKLIASRAYSHEHDWQRILKANFFHSLPYMLFVSLPLVALILQLLYIRRKQFYYVSHIIFSIHCYCFFFLTLLVTYTLTYCGTVGNIISVILRIGLFVYLYIAMLRFYKQGWFKTLIKFWFLLFWSGILFGILALIFLANAFLNVGAH